MAARAAANVLNLPSDFPFASRPRKSPRRPLISPIRREPAYIVDSVLSPRGSPKFYRATDNLQSEAYRGLLPEDLIEIVTINALHYSHNSESGVLFHLIGALSQYGKLGMTAIGNSREEVEALYDKTLRILDRETAIGR